MRWEVTAPGWERSDAGHGICKAASGRYAAWRGLKFLDWADSKKGAMQICEKDNKK